MASPEDCFICENSLSNGQTCIVKTKGLKTWISFSVKRRDGKDVILRRLTSVTVHQNCRKIYTKDRSAEALLRPSIKLAISSGARRNVPTFDFKQKCLFCAEDADEKFLKKESKKLVGNCDTVQRVETMLIKNTILKIVEDKDDKWSREIAVRIRTVDLVAAEARYHKSCIKKFHRAPTTGTKRGRPECTEVSDAMNHVYAFLEANREECQFSFDELFEEFKSEIPTQKTIKSKLLEKYGEDITITTCPRKKTIVCFRNTGHKILSKQWYTDQKSDMLEERLRIVKAAAEIICEDIRLKVYDTEHYPQSDDFLKNVEEDVPPTLDCLLKTIILKNKRGSIKKCERKCTAIAHAIIAATRPKSFLSGLQVGLSSFINQKYGWKQLINILSALSFCSSYDEAALFQVSAMVHPPALVIEDAFSQFVFDNADVNVCTVDGFNTFHAMGGIQCVTPRTAVSFETSVAKLKKMPSESSVGQFGKIPLKVFHKRDSSGLLTINIEDLNDKQLISKEILPSITDFLWFYGKSQNVPDLPGWNGYMERATTHLNYNTSRIICLPFTNAPPSDYDTIYTVLLTAIDKCKLAKQNTCFVTFDQPLYIKARDIIASSRDDSELNKVIVRLGGFHLLMSFMGAIGYIMNGSGLKELFNSAYASASVEKMLTGHAYAEH